MRRINQYHPSLPGDVHKLELVLHGSCPEAVGLSSSYEAE